MHDVIYLSYPVCDIDVVLKEPLPLHAGRTNQAERMGLVPGGGANTMFMASRLGMTTLALGVVGNDSFGRLVIEGYRQEGVDTAGIEVREGFNTLGVIVLNGPDGNHGFASMLSGGFVQTIDAAALLAGSRAACISGYMFASPETQEETLAFMQKASVLKKTIFFDPGPLPLDPALAEKAFSLTDILILNDAEAAHWTGGLEPEAAAKDLSARTRGMAVIKSGARGCYIFAEGAGRWHRGFEVTVLDTTGAGDVFLAALMRARIDGWDLDSSAALANAAGAATAAKQGTGHAVATVDEVIAVLAKSGYAVNKAALLSRGPYRLIKNA